MRKRWLLLTTVPFPCETYALYSEKDLVVEEKINRKIFVLSLVLDTQLCFII